MVIAKGLWLFNIWQEYLENLVISVTWALGKGGNSKYANHKFQVTDQIYLCIFEFICL